MAYAAAPPASRDLETQDPARPADIEKALALASRSHSLERAESVISLLWQEIARSRDRYRELCRHLRQDGLTNDVDELLARVEREQTEGRVCPEDAPGDAKPLSLRETEDAAGFMRNRLRPHELRLIAHLFRATRRGRKSAELKSAELARKWGVTARTIQNAARFLEGIGWCRLERPGRGHRWRVSLEWQTPEELELAAECLLMVRPNRPARGKHQREFRTPFRTYCEDEGTQPVPAQEDTKRAAVPSCSSGFPSSGSFGTLREGEFPATASPPQREPDRRPGRLSLRRWSQEARERWESEIRELWPNLERRGMHPGAMNRLSLWSSQKMGALSAEFIETLMPALRQAAFAQEIHTPGGYVTSRVLDALRRAP